MKLVKDTDNKNLETNKISDKEAEEAFKTILAWMGEIQIVKFIRTPKELLKHSKIFWSYTEMRENIR